MLTISFATRTDSTSDPLTERALALATEFMDLTGEFVFITQVARLTEVCPRSVVKHRRLYRASSMDSYSETITWTPPS
jgi:hypothetical protein